jgi:hypothetical protein
LEEISKADLKEGKKQLEGVLILCWIMAIITGMSILTGFDWEPVDFLAGVPGNTYSLYVFSDIVKNIAQLPFKLTYSLILPALYVVELIGLYNRRSFAVPLGRAVLVVTMVLFFPVGTIVGGILWKRFNHPLSKK